MLFHDSFLEVFGEVGAHLLAGTLDGYLGHVGVDHEIDKLLERGLGRGIPAEFPAGLGGVAPEVDHVGGTVEVGGDLDDHPAGGGVDALLGGALSLEAELDAGAAEGVEAELADGVLLAGGNDVVLGLGLLEDEPHTFHIVLGIAPVAGAGEVAKVEFLLLALGYAGGGEGDLAGDEGLAAAL